MSFGVANVMDLRTLVHSLSYRQYQLKYKHLYYLILINNIALIMKIYKVLL